MNKSGPIRCAAVDSTFTHVITTGDDKKLKVWQVADEFKLLSERYAHASRATESKS